MSDIANASDITQVSLKLIYIEVLLNKYTNTHTYPYALVEIPLAKHTQGKLRCLSPIAEMKIHGRFPVPFLHFFLSL